MTSFSELHEAERADTGRPDEREAGRASQPTILCFRPLAAAGSSQHVKVAHDTGTVLGFRRGKLRHDPLDHGQRPAGRQRVPTIAQDDPAPLVIPIMENALHQDRIGAARDFFKKTAGGEPAAAGDAEPIEMRTRICLAARKVERDALKMSRPRAAPARPAAPA